MSDRFVMFLLVIISAISTYVAASCYHQLSMYESNITIQSQRIDDLNSKVENLNEENYIVLKHIVRIDKKFKEVDEKQRVNDVRITELGAKLTRRK